MRDGKISYQHSYIISVFSTPDTYDHRLKRIGHPVRSAIHKLQIGGLVVGWVTTSESPLLYVSFAFFASVSPLFGAGVEDESRGNL